MISINKVINSVHRNLLLSFNRESNDEVIIRPTDSSDAQLIFNSRGVVGGLFNIGYSDEIIDLTESSDDDIKQHITDRNICLRFRHNKNSYIYELAKDLVDSLTNYN